MKQHGTKNLDLDARMKLQKLLKQTNDKKQIATELSVSLGTIYNEIRRGTKNGRYDANYAHKKYVANLESKGRRAELSLNTELAKRISRMILTDSMSPEAIYKQLRSEGEYCPSKQTIYLAIDNGLIPHVTRDSLKNNITTVFSKGLVQLPKWARVEMKLADGDKIQFDLKGNCLVLTKVSNNKDNGSF